MYFAIGTGGENRPTILCVGTHKVNCGYVVCSRIVLRAERDRAAGRVLGDIPGGHGPAGFAIQHVLGVTDSLFSRF